MRLLLYGISGLTDTNDTVDSTQFIQSESLDQTTNLISDYFEIKNLLGQSPTSEDIEIYGRYKINEYIDKWGNWDKFLEHIGEKIIISDELKQDLIKEYYEERELFGSDPSPQEIDEFGIYKMDDYKKVFGSWFGFLIYIEELDKLNGKNEKEEISKDALISDFYNLKKHLDHVPSIKEINTLGKYGVDFYTYHFGSYDRFLMTVNEKITLKISDDNLIKNYYNVKEKIGKQPSSTDLQAHGKYSYQVYMKRYGSFNNFLIKIGEPIVRGFSSISKEDLFFEYLRIKDKLGREPKIKDIETNSKYHFIVYQKRFGSWLDFKKDVSEFIEISH